MKETKLNSTTWNRLHYGCAT